MSLPDPYWQSPCGNHTLYCGDALSILPAMKAGSVNAVVTDPPYGEITHKGARTRTIGADSDALVSFASMTNQESCEAFSRLVNTASRWVVATCEWRHAAAMESYGLPLVRLGVWIKPNSAPQLTGDRPATGWEAIAILHREGQKRWNGGGSRAVWICNRVDATHHPTEKPLELFEKFVAAFSDIGETILDPFAGSGTTAVACIRTGRKSISIEKEPKYCAIAKRRMEEAIGIGSLFDPKVIKEVDMFAECV